MPPLHKYIGSWGLGGCVACPVPPSKATELEFKPRSDVKAVVLTTNRVVVRINENIHILLSSVLGI